jgi:cell division protease FtsH
VSRFFKSAAFPILLVILLAFFVQNLFYGSKGTEALTFNQFQTAVKQGNLKTPVTVKTKDLVVVGELKDGRTFQVGFTQAYNMEEFLLANNVDFNTDIQKSSVWVTLLGTFAPILLMVVFFIFLMNQMQGGGVRS